jgi:hypothetical protein
MDLIHIAAPNDWTHTLHTPTDISHQHSEPLSAQSGFHLASAAPATALARVTDRFGLAPGSERAALSGRLAHALIGELLAHTPSPTFHDLQRASARLAVRRADTSVAQRAITSAANWFSLYPVPERWELAGTEVPVPGARLDLLWRTPLGLVGEEVKTGISAALSERALQAQARRQLDGLLASSASRVRGLAVTVVGAHERAFAMTLDGRVAGLEVVGR